MPFPTRINSGVPIIEAQGRIVLAEGANVLHDTVVEVLDTGSKKIILDLEAVTFMDSSGVGKLVHCLTSTTDRDGVLKLLKIPQRVYDVLDITQVLQLFEHFTEEEEAVASFQ